MAQAFADSSTETATTTIPDGVWEQFWKAQEAELKASRVLLDDPNALTAIGATPSYLSPDPFFELTGSEQDVDHALENIKNLAPLPNHPGTHEIETDGRAVKNAVHEADQKVQQQVQDLKDRNEKNQPPPSDDDWNSQMDDIRDKTKEEVNKRIDEAFEKLKKRGNENKAERPVLLKIAKGLQSFILALTDFLAKAFAWLARKLEEIWEAIKKAAQWVWDKIKRAADAVAKFFGF